MKYLTLHWWIDCQKLDWQSDEVRLPMEKHKQYYASVKEQLPSELAKFKDEYSLHDATFLSMRIDVEKQTAQFDFLISIRPEKKPMFEKKGTLLYSGVKSFGSSEDIEYSLAGPGGHGDLGHDEIEIIDTGLYEHRMLFSSGIEFAVRFTNFKYEIAT